MVVSRSTSTTTNTSTIFLILTFVLFTQSITSSSPPTDGFLFGGCTQQKYSADSAYEANVDSLLASLVNSATYSSYNNFTVTGSTQHDVVYGLFQCRGDLAMPDCATCVARAVSQLGPLCSQTCGGALQLQGCYVKYDNATFLGVEDKTVVLKKCGPSEGYDADGLARRDAVLGSLVGFGGLHRVGGSGDVQGVAQCLGDLSSAECQDCVSYAIGRLKSDCGQADFGDMFLAKCYARYSTGGAHYYSKRHHDKSTDDGEKTFAVIIGLLAGIALLIIFIAFLRKIYEGHAK